MTGEDAPLGMVLSAWPSSQVAQLPPERITQDCSVSPCATYASIQGTSMAAPHVTGVVALMLSRYGRMSLGTVTARLPRTATPLTCPSRLYNPLPQALPDVDFTATCVGGPGHTSFYGAGIMDALAALSR